MLEIVKIVALATIAAVLYGIAQDQLTARVSAEYFLVAHPRLVASRSPTIVAIAWGAAATWWLGAVLGLLLAVAARAGARPRRSAASLVRPVAILMAVAASLAVVLGATGWLGAERELLQLREPFASSIAPHRHARFFAAWGATAGAYAAGVVGGLLLCAVVWRSRQHASATPMPRSDQSNEGRAPTSTDAT